MGTNSENALMRGHRQHRASRRARRNPKRLRTGAIITTLTLGAVYSAAALAVSLRSEPQSVSQLASRTSRPTPTPPAHADDQRTRITEPASANPSTTIQKVPQGGPGTFAIAHGATATVGTAGSTTVYRVEVEDGLGLDADTFADTVDSTLVDPRGWTKNGTHSFRRAPTGALRIVLATPTTTDRLCAPLQTQGEVSCRNGKVVAINAVRWFNGAEAYKGDLKRYRLYVINHEVGHSLGFHHASCPTPGAKAPVMLQQTLGLQGCEPNPWP